MIRLYDQALKRISRILDHCLSLTHRFQHTPKETKEDVSVNVEENDPVYQICAIYGMDAQNNHILKDVLQVVKASSHEETRRIAECLVSLCEILSPEDPEVWRVAYDMLIDLDHQRHLEDQQREAINYLDFIRDWLHKSMPSSNQQRTMIGIRTSLQYHRDMDTELTVMTDDDYQDMVVQLNTMLLQYGVERLHIEQTEPGLAHKNPFATLGYEISQQLFHYKAGSQNSNNTNHTHTGLALIQINVGDDGRWTDFVGLADFDQALRLKSLFDIYYLSDKLHVWRGYKEWPTNNRLYCVSIIFPQVCDERERMHRALNQDVLNANFNVEMNRSIFMGQLHDAFEFSDGIFEWNHRQAALRLRDVFERLLNQASRSKEPIRFEAFVDGVLEEACLCGEALRSREETLFEELAKDNASFSLQHLHHGGSDGDYFMAQYEEALMKYKALMSPARYAKTRLHGAAKCQGNPFCPDQFHASIMRLLYNRGMLSLGIPKTDETMTLDQCCTAWSLLIPDNLTLIVYDALLHKEVYYLQIVPGAYARQIYAILAHHKISHQFRVYIHGRRRFF